MYASVTLFTNTDVETFVRNRIFSTKVPTVFDPLSASKIALCLGNRKLVKWYTQLSYANNIIIAVRDSWKKIILNQRNLSDMNVEVLDKEFTDRGIFSDFVLALLSHDYNLLDNSIINHAEELYALNIGQPGVFLTTLRQLTYDVLFLKPNESDQNTLDGIKSLDEEFEQESQNDFIDQLNQLIYCFQGKTRRKKENKKGKKTKIISLSKFYHPTDVNDQVGWIKDRIEEGDIKNAEHAILKLIEFQDLYSNAEHLCKSLCDIAESFQKRNQIEISNVLANAAINLYPNDIIPHTIIADNLRAMYQYERSLLKYEEMNINFKLDLVARCGKAETLRLMGRLDEALIVYEETINEFNDDVVPRNGRAETLRQIGRLDEALKAFEDTVSDFDNEIYPRIGKAETLRQMGRLDEALSAYEDTISNFNDEIYPRTGKAETLRQMGRLEEALRAYEETISDFQNDPVPRSGRAETLRQMGRLEEALAAYEKTISDFQNDPVPRSGRAETLRQMGRLDEALIAYEETIRDFKNVIIPRNGKAETLRQMGQLDEALKVYEEIIHQVKYAAFSRNGRAETLRQMGRLNEALAAYEENISDFKNDIVSRNGKALCLQQMGKFGEAIEYYQIILRDFPYDQVTKRAKFVLQIQLGTNLDQLEYLTEVAIPTSKDDWIMNHIHCMLLIKRNKFDKAIEKLSYGVENVKDFVTRNYYQNALSFAYIKIRNFNAAINQLASIPIILPIKEVLATHAYAGNGNISESINHFNSILRSEIKNINELSKRISDCYNLSTRQFFVEKSKQELEIEIENLEFELLAESFLIAA